MDTQYKLLSSEDIKKYNANLISLMEMILRDNITQNYPDTLPLEYVEKMPGYIEDGSAIIVGAVYNEELIGFSWAYELSIFNERRIHIDMIGVNTKYRKNGLAKHLVDMQIEESKKRGVYIIEAMTTKVNSNSYKWFHDIGFIDERVKVKLEIQS